MTTANTPFQRDIDRMIDALTVERPRVGAADDALKRRIHQPDTGTDTTTLFRAGDGYHPKGGTPADPTGSEAARRLDAQEQRELYRDTMLEVWAAIKRWRQETDNVLRNEPLLPHGAPVCSTRRDTPNACGKFASPHTNPLTGLVIEDLCDRCYWELCPRCYLRPMAEYRPTCDACRKRAEREAA